jgi:hypothetical protein
VSGGEGVGEGVGEGEGVGVGVGEGEGEGEGVVDEDEQDIEMVWCAKTRATALLGVQKLERQLLYNFEKTQPFKHSKVCEYQNPSFSATGGSSHFLDFLRPSVLPVNRGQCMVLGCA